MAAAGAGAVRPRLCLLCLAVAILPLARRAPGAPGFRPAPAVARGGLVQRRQAASCREPASGDTVGLPVFRLTCQQLADLSVGTVVKRGTAWRTIMKQNFKSKYTKLCKREPKIRVPKDTKPKREPDPQKVREQQRRAMQGLSPRFAHRKWMVQTAMRAEEDRAAKVYARIRELEVVEVALREAGLNAPEFQQQLQDDIFALQKEGRVFRMPIFPGSDSKIDMTLAPGLRLADAIYPHRPFEGADASEDSTHLFHVRQRETRLHHRVYDTEKIICHAQMQLERAKRGPDRDVRVFFVEAFEDDCGGSHSWSSEVQEDVDFWQGQVLNKVLGKASEFRALMDEDDVTGKDVLAWLGTV